MIDEEYDAQAFDATRLESWSIVVPGYTLAGWLRHAFRGREHCNQMFIVTKVIAFIRVIELCSLMNAIRATYAT